MLSASDGGSIAIVSVRMGGAFLPLAVGPQDVGLGLAVAELAQPLLVRPGHDHLDLPVLVGRATPAWGSTKVWQHSA